MLAFGADSNVVMINGTFRKDSGTQMGEDIQKSLFSVVYESNKIVDPLENVGFEVNVVGTKLKFAKSISNSLVYTVDGKVPTESDDKCNMVVASSIGQTIIEDKVQYSVNRLQKIPTIQGIEVQKMNNITIDNLQGTEIIAYGTDKKKGEREMVYQVMLFTDRSYYLIIGTSRDDFEENLLIFKKISLTFKRK